MIPIIIGIGLNNINVPINRLEKFNTIADFSDNVGDWNKFSISFNTNIITGQHNKIIQVILFFVIGIICLKAKKLF
jgi:hypothetical protein